MFGEGISKYADILDIAANIDIVSKSGAWYAYKGEKIGQGRENAKTFLKNNPDICNEIEAQIRERYCLFGDEPEASKDTKKADKKASDSVEE